MVLAHSVDVAKTPNPLVYPEDAGAGNLWRRSIARRIGRAWAPLTAASRL
jgi:hypothetical protein